MKRLRHHPPLLSLAPWAALALSVGCQVAKPAAPEAPKPARPAALTLDERPSTVAPIQWERFPRLPPPKPPRGLRVLWVAPGGTGDGSQDAPMGSIQQAATAAGSKAWIWVKEGVYREGAPGNYIGVEVPGSDLVISAEDGAKVEIRPASEAHTYGVVLHGDRVALRGLRLEGFTRNGVLLASGKTTQRGVVLDRVSMRMALGDFSNGVIMAEIPDRVGVPAIEGLLLHEVEVLDASLGITCGRGPCNDLRFHRVKVANKTRDAGSGADAIAVEDGRNVAMTEVEATGAGADGIDLKAEGILLAGVWSHHNARNGIKLWHGGDVVNARVDHVGADAAVALKAPGKYRLLHVLVAYHNHKGPSSYVMTVGHGQEEAVELEIRNSVFWRNAGGIYLSPQTRAKLEHNVFAESDNGKFLEQGERFVTLDEGELTPWGPHNQLLPKLPMQEDGGFGLDSPLRDAGKRDPEDPSTDLRGEARVRGAAPDLGPWEVQ